jgi:N6-L-threonylcarbamoyladenine synthase
MLVLQSGPGSHEILGETIDDAAGEAYDKVARWLGLGYPGGPEIDKLAQRGNAKTLQLPKSMTGEGYDLSFSGLKTAVVRATEKLGDLAVEDVAASFQGAVAEQLLRKVRQALEKNEVKALSLAGGVAANSALRQGISKLAEEFGIPALLPSMQMCTDNAAMIAAAGIYRFQHQGASHMNLSANPNWQLVDIS